MKKKKQLTSSSYSSCNHNLSRLYQNNATAELLIVGISL